MVMNVIIIITIIVIHTMIIIIIMVKIIIVVVVIFIVCDFITLTISSRLFGYIVFSSLESAVISFYSLGDISLFIPLFILFHQYPWRWFLLSSILFNVQFIPSFLPLISLPFVASSIFIIFSPPLFSILLSSLPLSLPLSLLFSSLFNSQRQYFVRDVLFRWQSTHLQKLSQNLLRVNVFWFDLSFSRALYLIFIKFDFLVFPDFRNYVWCAASYFESLESNILIFFTSL